MITALFMAVLIPLASGWHKNRKVFMHEVGKTTDGAQERGLVP